MEGRGVPGRGGDGDGGRRELKGGKEEEAGTGLQRREEEEGTRGS